MTPHHHIHDVCPVGPSYLVGVSGGADSTALLHLLVEAGHKKLIVCHLHHGLRARHADADLRFVEKISASLRLRCRHQHTDVAQLASSQSLSLETAARQARHEFFIHCAKIHRCPRIILAHHADDQAETALFSILRGSHGIRAMSPIQPLHHNNKTITLLRPLLETRRADLESYLRHHRIAWRKDHTNDEPFCTRNRIRLEAIPLLNEIMQRDITPTLLRQCESTADLIATEQWIIDTTHAQDPQGRLHLPTLRSLPASVQTIILRHYLATHGITETSRSHLQQARALIDTSSPPSINLPGGHRLRRRQNRIFVEISHPEP